MEDAKQAQSLKSMKFNRFLWFRYVTAAFFFTNLYWSVLLIGSGGLTWLIPVGLLLVDLAVTVEQTRKYWHPERFMPVTRWGYWVQLLVNVGLVISVIAGSMPTLFPFVNSHSQSAIIWILTFGTIVSLWIERRVYLVEHDQDTYLRRQQTFESSLR
jgi:hypothetical protein